MLLSHRKYDHKIVLEEYQNPGHTPLYKMSPQKLDIVKHYLDLYLAKGFIQASSVSYLFPILFVKKPGRGIEVCVDHQRLNAITKKNQYSIPLIKETLAHKILYQNRYTGFFGI